MNSNRLWAIVAVVAAVGCSDAALQERSIDDTKIDDKLALTGRVCTQRATATGFPVKVVMVVDQSGSMCISDPPGSQESTGFCEMAAALFPGVTEPARVRALKNLVGQFQMTENSNVQVALVPFETNIKGAWPQGGGFARPNGDLLTRVSQLQSELGKGTDYQGALAYAYALIASDIAKSSVSDPQELARTRYVVVFLTDGVPFPRCSANDTLGQYADDLNPDLIWADAQGTGDFCNLTDQGDDAITGCPNGASSCANQTQPFIPGTDRNQNYQLFNYVDQLMELKNQFNIGDIRLHTVLLFNKEAVTACGPICQDVYGRYVRYPGNGAMPVPVPDGPAAAKAIAGYILKQLADRGNGVYQEFNDFYGIGQINLGALDYSSLKSDNVMKSFIVQALSSEPGDINRNVDSDGDGLIDTLDNNFTFKTNRFFQDSDNDGFDDLFEATNKEDGFVADTLDVRGCDPMSVLTPGCSITDVDGDGLNNVLERYIDTRNQSTFLSDHTFVDSDGDGIPNGIEVRYGLNPLQAQSPGLDTDGDGVPDVQEVKIGSNPTKRDEEFIERHSYQYEVQGEKQNDGSTCYDFTVSNLQLVSPESRAGQRQGFNRFKLWFGEAPESGVATDFGVWRTACAWAQYAPPTLRVPAGPQLDPIRSNQFLDPGSMVTDSQFETRCAGISPSRGQTTP